MTFESTTCSQSRPHDSAGSFLARASKVGAIQHEATSWPWVLNSAKIAVAASIVLTWLAFGTVVGAVQTPGGAASRQPATPQAGPAIPLPPGNYVIGPEDVLGIVFWKEPEMSGDVTVRPDGRITIPVIGEMQASGRRPEELQKEIVAAATKYISGVNVVVVVRAINSRKIFVTGRVTSPGAHPLMGPLTVIQAIALAGGLTEYADPKGITVLRIENGRSRTLQFNYHDIARGKSLEQNIQLQPGDTVVVP